MLVGVKLLDLNLKLDLNLDMQNNCLLELTPKRNIFHPYLH